MKAQNLIWEINVRTYDKIGLESCKIVLMLRLQWFLKIYDDKFNSGFQIRSYTLYIEKS